MSTAVLVIAAIVLALVALAGGSAVFGLTVYGMVLLSEAGAAADKRWQEALSAVAGAFDLGTASGRSVSGRVDGLELVVDIETEIVNDMPEETQRIRCGGKLPGSLLIRPDFPMHHVFGGQDVQLGDRALDAAAIFSGEHVHTIRGRMDADTRAAVLRAVRAGARLEKGWWILTLQAKDLEPARIVALASLVHEAARVIARTGGDTTERLLGIAATDPLPEVRRNAFASLRARLKPGDWLVPFTADPDPRVRVVAAAALGPQGRDVLLGLLDPGDPLVHRTAALALADLANDGDRARIEAALLPYLGTGNTRVIEALGRIGTAVSVPPLTRLADAGLGLGSVARQARRAIGAIHGRLAGVGTGGLALADPGSGAGALTIADSGTSALADSESLADDRARTAARLSRERSRQPS